MYFRKILQSFHAKLWECVWGENFQSRRLWQRKILQVCHIHGGQSIFICLLFDFLEFKNFYVELLKTLRSCFKLFCCTGKKSMSKHKYRNRNFRNRNGNRNFRNRNRNRNGNGNGNRNGNGNGNRNRNRRWNSNPWRHKRPKRQHRPRLY